MSDFELIDITDDQQLLNELIDGWLNDIEKFNPDFEPLGLSFVTSLLIKVEGESAGLFMYQSKDKEVHVELDYVSEKYRDLGIGTKMFAQIRSSFIKKGRSKIVALQYNDAHGQYLASLGFKPSSKYKHRYELQLK